MSAADDIAIVDSDGETDFSYVAHGQSKLADRVLRSSHSSSSRSLNQRRGSSPCSNMASSSNGSLSSKQSAAKRGSLALFDDQDPSLLDPRRFTPTLHASLVSEILSLRRELESRNHVIEDLESTLEETRDTADSLSDSLAHATRENRTLKRQMSLVEGGTFSAVEELTRERDEILESANDLRKRLEQAHQKIKSQEEDHDKAQKFWEQDQLKWQSERRDLETKIHITEGRLKAVLQEIMLHQSLVSNSRPASSGSNASVPDNRTITGSRTPSIKSGRTSPVGLRRTSIESDDRRTVRFSMDSMNMQINDMNLADELALDDEDCFDNDRPESRSFIYDGRPTSVMSSKRGSMPWSALRYSMDMSRHMGSPDLLERLQNLDTIVDMDINSRAPTTSLEYRDAAVQFTPPPSPGPSVSSEKSVEDEASKPVFSYRDAGVQFTPPPSPPLSAIVEHTEDHTIPEEKVSHYKDTGVQHELVPGESLETTDIWEERQSHVNIIAEEAEKSTLAHGESDTILSPIQSADLVSSSCQTTDELLEDLLKAHGDFENPQEEKPRVTYTESAAVQTDEISPDELKFLPFAGRCQDRMSFEIPLIAIHPPASNPPTPRSSVVLPPHTKNASCQVDRSDFETTQSIATQTEEIRIDQRKVRLPQGLLPSPIPYFPNDSLSPGDSTSETPFPPPKSPRRKLFQLIRRGDPNYNSTAPSSPKSSDENDTSPRGYKRIQRKESTTFDSESQTDYASTKTENSSTLPSLSGHQAHQLEQLDEEENEEDEVLSRASFVSEMPMGTLRRTLTLARSTKKPTRSLATHSASSQTMDSDATAQLPYPVPVRHSSRNRAATNSNFAHKDDPTYLPLYLTAEDTPEWAVSSRKEGRAGNYAARSHDGTRTPVARAKLKEPMKRVRANAVPKATTTPGARTISPAAERSPTPPSLHDASLMSPPILKNKQSSGHLQSSRTESSYQQTSVVDAIAQTMVGEWMWKYVRRRRSFTVSENRDNMGKLGEEGGSGARHKRWVWLAPYERAVMWSSKQPTNGTALLGKSGRKRKWRIGRATVGASMVLIATFELTGYHSDCAICS